MSLYILDTNALSYLEQNEQSGPFWNSVKFTNWM
jgi:hypothetical protein